jgi:hypothetical protein
MREHRVPMLSAPLRRYPDPEMSADPRIYTLLTDLRTLDVAPLPRAHFRAELRSQLVAVTPRLVAEGVSVERPLTEAARPTTAATPARHSARPSPPVRLAALRTLSLGRPVAIVTAIVAVFALLLGGAVFISKRALPGDALYSLKRANETVQLSLADGPTAKSKAYLNFAGERADEVAALLKRASALAAASGPTAGGISAHTASLVDSTLSSGDDDVRNAARLLGDAAVAGASGSPLSIMTTWAPGQVTKLQAIVGKLPAGPVRDHAAASAQLVGNAVLRAQQLTGMISCTCLKSASSDDLGPLPCQPCMSPRSSPLPTLPSTVPVPGRTTTGATPTGTAGSSTDNSAAATTGDTGAGSGSDSSSDSGSGSTSPKHSLGITLPTLPQITFPSKTGTKTATSTCVLSLLGLCVKFG